MGWSPCLRLNQFPLDTPESFHYKALVSPRDVKVYLKTLLFGFLMD